MRVSSPCPLQRGIFLHRVSFTEHYPFSANTTRYSHNPARKALYW